MLLQVPQRWLPVVDIATLMTTTTTEAPATRRTMEVTKSSTPWKQWEMASVQGHRMLRSLRCILFHQHTFAANIHSSHVLEFKTAKKG